jgi:hypothetical protein
VQGRRASAAHDPGVGAHETTTITGSEFDVAGYRAVVGAALAGRIEIEAFVPTG